jgi:ketosteroid isomerase-like protein
MTTTMWLMEFARFSDLLRREVSLTIEQEIRSCVRRYYGLIDARDIEAMLKLFSDDCVYERPGYEPLEDRRALEHFYRNDRVIESGKHELQRVVVEADCAFTEGTFTGMLRNGQEVEVRFADVFQFRGVEIARRRTYFFAPSV